MALNYVLIALLFVAPVIDWIVAAILVRAAVSRSARERRIRALQERAILAVGVAVATSFYLLDALNTETGHSLFTDDVGRLLSRFIIATVGLLPVIWLVLYLRGFQDQ